MQRRGDRERRNEPYLPLFRNLVTVFTFYYHFFWDFWFFFLLFCWNTKLSLDGAGYLSVLLDLRILIGGFWTVWASFLGGRPTNESHDQFPTNHVGFHADVTFDFHLFWAHWFNDSHSHPPPSPPVASLLISEPVAIVTRPIFQWFVTNFRPSLPPTVTHLLLSLLPFLLLLLPNAINFFLCLIERKFNFLCFQAALYI